jgi:TolB protein
VPHQVTAEEVYAGQPTWSPDGTQLAYVAKREGNWDVWLVDLAGGEPRQLTDNPAMDWSPAWSPDGKRLAFVSPRSGSYQIHLIGVDGGGLQVLTDFVRGAESPAWSPGGEWLAFVAYTGAAVGVDAREIYLMRADGTYRVRLTKNMSDDTEPAWGGQPANGG